MVKLTPAPGTCAANKDTSLHFEQAGLKQRVEFQKISSYDVSTQ
jgi:hypothetical protein